MAHRQHGTGGRMYPYASCAIPGRNEMISIGDYVLATKYSDGYPGDHFAIGFYNGSYDHYGQTRHLVIDSTGKSFRANGFRRVEKIGIERGTWMVNHFAHIEAMMNRYSVWHWYRAPWAELDAVDAPLSQSEKETI